MKKIIPVNDPRLALRGDYTEEQRAEAIIKLGEWLYQNTAMFYFDNASAEDARIIAKWMTEE